MKKNEPPIPVRSVVGLPRWLMVAGVASCSVLALGCIGLIVWGLFFVDAPWRGARGGWVGGGLGGLIGCAGGLFGALCDWRRRLPAPALLWHVQHDAPLPFYRRVFWPALIVFAASCVAAWFLPRMWWQGFMQASGMIAFLSGTMEVARRHTTRQARALFALYADGALPAEDRAAIDDARAKDAKFDAEVRAWQALDARVRELTAPPDVTSGAP